MLLKVRADLETLLKSLAVLTPQNDVRQVLSDSFSKTPAGKKS
jgi:hypothetical protein